MISNVKLISEEYFRSKIPFNNNVDFKDISVHIPTSQDIHLQPILGSNFYDEILQKYNDQTLTPDEITLVNHIKPCVAFRTAYSTLPFLTYNIKNKGVQTQNGDFSDSVEKSNLSYLNNLLENRAEFYEQRLINYLDEYESLYSGYTINNKEDIKPNDNTSYDSGFALYD